MNTELSAFTMDSMLHVRRSAVEPVDGGSERLAAFFADTDSLTCIGDVALEYAQPDLLQSLTRLVHQAGPLLPGMEDALDSLKEAFLELLRARLADADISLDARLVLGLDAAGRFGVIDAGHPQCEALDDLLAATPELEAAMREIARQSLLLRGLQDIGQVVGCEPDALDALGALDEAGGAESMDMGSLGQDAAYHVCLKGALSHFYFPAR